MAGICHPDVVRKHGARSNAMIYYEPENEREQEWWQHLHITRVPASTPGENIRPAWPAYAFDDLRPLDAPQADAGQYEEVWYFEPDDDPPRNYVTEVLFRTSNGK